MLHFTAIEALQDAPTENPLDIPITDSLSQNGGRPKWSEAVKFAPQPRSLLISQLLKEPVQKRKTIESEILSVKDQDVKVPIKPLEDNEEPPSADSSSLSGILKENSSVRKSLKLFSCNYPNCTYSCKLSCNLIKHKRKHAPEKTYICEQCAFRTNFVNSLKVHQRLHTSERLYKCTLCPYKCNSSSNLKKHCLCRHPELKTS